MKDFKRLFSFIVTLSIMFGFICGNFYFKFEPIMANAETLPNSNDFVKIVAGEYHSLGIKTDGSLWAWGLNNSGQLGDGTTINKTTPKKTIDSGVIEIAAGEGHSLAIKTDGSLWAWGLNDSGQLGDGTAINQSTPTKIMDNVKSVEAGEYYSFAIMKDDSLWAWGGNGNGQYGNGTTISKSTPTKIMDSIASVSAGSNHTLAIKKDGSLWAWGGNGNGQIGNGIFSGDNITTPIKIMDSVASVSAGANHSLAIKNDGSLWAWGDNGSGQLACALSDSYKTTPVKILDNIVSVSAGSNHTLAIKTDGSLWAWGNNYSSQYGDGTLGTKNSIPVKIMDGVKSISSSNHILAIKTDLSLWAWGDNIYGQIGDGTIRDRLTPAKTMYGFVSVSGNNHTLAIKNDGSLWAWGSNEYGQLGDGTTIGKSTPTKIMDSILAVSTGNCYTFAIKTDGSLWAWGRNEYGQLGNGNWGYYAFKTTPVKIMDDVVAVSAGGGHSLAIKTDGSLWAWGRNLEGQLGDETTIQSAMPKKIIDFGVIAIASGRNHSLALKTDGSLWAWGNNYSGILGDGTTIDSHTPKQIIASGIQTISAGTYHTLALKTDGSLWAWGLNNSGQLGDGTTTDSYTPKQIIASGVQAIAAGESHTIAVKTDGSLWAWGNNEHGQLGDGTTGYNNKLLKPKQIMANGVQAISAGYLHTLAVKTDGSLWTWGLNESGQLGYYNSNIPTKVQIETKYIYENTDSISLLENEKVKFELGYTPNNFNSGETVWSIKYMSSDYVLLNESNSVVTAKESGTAVIKATSSDGKILYKEFSIAVWENGIKYLGVKDEKIYNTDRLIMFDGLTATLNGEIFVSGSTISNDGDYSLVVIDSQSNSETVTFTIDKTPPVITISPYNTTTPSYKPITVTANTNEGTLNATRHTFTENGSFTFEVMDKAGNYTSKTVTITNIQEMLFDEKTGTITSYKGSATNYTIPSQINGVAVIKIGDYAFADCTSLVSITIPNGITTIGESAFIGCTSLTTINIPSSVTTIENGAFSFCSALTTITIPSSVTTVGDGILMMTAVTNPVIVQNGKTLVYVPMNSISYVIPNTVTTISGMAFYLCTDIPSITIPSSITTIGDMAFSGCFSLTTITIPNTVTNIGDGILFATLLEQPVFAQSGKTLIYVSMNTTSYTIPSTVTKIGGMAFYMCSELTSINIPNNVTSIGNMAFGECTSLSSINIPNTVTTIGHGILSGTNISNPVIVQNGKTLIYVPVNSSSYEIPNTVSTIGSMAFYNCTELTSVKIPSSVLTIGDSAFASCSILMDVIIPNSVTTIEEGAFAGCSSLKKILIPKSVTSIGEHAFEGCEELIIYGDENSFAQTYANDNSILFQVRVQLEITISNYNTLPTNQSITITASTNIGSLNTTTHTFTENGSFEFIATDIDGTEIKKTVIVTNIDKIAPVITIGNYSTTLTNKDISVTASTNEGTLNETSHTFTENGSFEFIAKDDAGNETKKTVTITNIDKVAPILTIDNYSTAPTNKDIIVTASTNEDTLNATSHTFAENGSFEFIAKDDAGNETKKTVTITNIDKVAPILTIDNYSTAPTNKDIIVTASTNEGALNATSHTFTANGSFEFIATDSAGNVTKKTVTITNIDKIAPIVSGVSNNGYYYLTTTITFNEGTATLNGLPFTSGEKVSKDGDYTLIVIDDLGNTTTITFEFNTTALKGDINSDGNIKADDVSQVLSAIKKKIVLSDIQKASADANNDGKVNVLDALMILRLVKTK